MLALILFAVAKEDEDNSAAVAVKDMEVLITLDEAAMAAEALAADLQVACILFCLLVID